MAIDLDAYCAWLRERALAPTTVSTYRTQIRGFRDWLNDKPLSVVTMTEYRDWLMGEKPPQEEGGASGRRPRTVQGAFCALRSLWKWLELQGATDLPSLATITLPRRDTARRHFPTQEELRKILLACSQFGAERADRRYGEWRKAQAGVLVALPLFCGLRRREMLSLNRTDLLEQNGRWMITVRHGKGAQSRWVPVPAEALRYLQAWEQERDRRQKRLGQSGPWLLVDDRGRRLGMRSVENVLRGVMQLAGLGEQGITLHCFRHSYASALLSGGADAKTVSQLLGHSSVAVTLEVYCHTTPELMHEAAAKAAGRIQAPKPQQGTDSRRGDSARRQHRTSRQRGRQSREGRR